MERKTRLFRRLGCPGGRIWWAVWILAAAGCGCAPESPHRNAPVVYDFAERLTYADTVTPWHTLDFGQADSATWLDEAWSEPMDAGGTGGRWATRRTASLRFLSFVPQPMTLSLMAYPYTRGYAAQTATVRVNGKTIGRIRFAATGVPTEYVLAVPPDTLVDGENRVEFRCRYVSARKQQAIFVSRVMLRPVDGSQARPAALSAPVRAGAGWEQPGYTRVTWKVAIPRRATLRLHPAFASGAIRPAGRVFLRTGSRRLLLASFDEAPDQAVTFPVPMAGARGVMEFEANGPDGVRWTVCELGGEVDSRDANVLFLTIDSLRADHVGVYGYARATTPTLDDLARRGTQFRSAWASSVFSVPSHATMLTGRYPQSHGIRFNGQGFDRQQLTLADLLGRNGMKTAAYVNWTLLAMPRMTGRGFAKTRHIKGTPGNLTLEGNQNVYANALRWIEAGREDRFFLWVHSQFLHLDRLVPDYNARFLPPDRREAAQGLIDRIEKNGIREVFDDHHEGLVRLSVDERADLISLYDGLLRMTDDFISGLLDGLRREGLDAITAVIVTSDHGMLFGEDGRLSHVGPPVWELQAVPLIAVLPGIGQVPGRVVDGFVETVDIAPTILAYLGMPIPRRMQGHSLLPLTTGEPARGWDYAYAMIGGLEEYYGVRSSDWLYFVDKAGREKLIHESRPRGSFASVASRHPDTVATLRAELQRWVRGTPEVGSDKDAMSEEIQEMLKKSGYLRYAK